MRVMGVVCALWSCGTEKCPFDFGGRMCVRFRAEERADEGADERLGSRIVLQTINPEGNGSLLSSDPEGRGKWESSGPCGSGRPSAGAICPRCPRIVLHNEWLHRFVRK